MPRLVLISDTHALHDALDLPPGDILVHAGDLTARGDAAEVERFMAWFGAQTQFAARVLVAGNHDLLFEGDPARARRLVPGNVVYLQDGGATVLGLRFYGSPVTPRFQDWAFGAPADRIGEVWARVPEGLDVLVTHGPPFGVLDRLPRHGAVGCPALRERVEAARPRVHVFGHIHEGRGETTRGATRFVNAAVLDGGYAPRFPATVLDLAAR